MKHRRLQLFSHLVEGRNLKQVIRENKAIGRYITHLGILSKRSLPF